ncbi:flagellar assembly protein FliH [Shewanella sp. SR44-3]|uniref:flagellar assembly protein FliH n=1 Tax=unclassified Shewanella TaxID=196818 RepID=UPI0015FD8AE0|nr:flagellar assembly protein FliH [Shewanella sp. SR44-3]MBB1268080.1 flagellar assembly protein FliH [Shewanella sp. SR44-3]
MTESKPNRFKHVLSVDDEPEFSHWRLPDMSDAQSLGPSNLYGKKPQPHVVDEPVEEEPKPLTMAQLEEMRAIAEQEGFQQGKEEGYQVGLEQGRLEGLEQGHQQGLEQGEQQGLETGKAEADALVQRFSHILEQFEKPLAVLDQEIESELLSLVLALSKAVIINEINTHPEHILAALRQGINSLPIKEQQIKIRVNQQDAELISQFYSQEQLDKNSWQLDVDPALSGGDCIIDSVRSAVDLRIEERMAQVLEDLKQQSSGLGAEIQANKGDDKGYTTDIIDADEFNIHKAAESSKQDALASAGDNTDAHQPQEQGEAEHQNESLETEPVELTAPKSTTLDAEIATAPSPKPFDTELTKSIDSTDSVAPQEQHTTVDDDSAKENHDAQPSTSTSQ